MSKHRVILAFGVLLALMGIAGCRPGPVATPTAAQPAGTTPTVAAATPAPSPTPAQAPKSTPGAKASLEVPTLSPQPTTPQGAEALPSPETATWTPVIQGLNQPTALVPIPGWPGYLLVLERGGMGWVWDGQERRPFFDLRDRVTSRGAEQGLLGAAFHPDFPQTPWVFVNYTDRQGDTAVVRYPVNPDTLQADAGQELRLLRVEQPYGNHNGGHLIFGPDGYLYIGLGDGGAAGDPHDYAQNPQVLLGKMLRIDVNQEPYGIPPDNPFVQGGGLPEIWATGLRNPWRYDFDPATGDLYIADVGQDAWEEVNVLLAPLPAGVNFGWPFYEGSHPYKGNPPAGVEFVFPVTEYGHDQGCSITGGVVYRGENLGAAWQGVYLYGDFCSGRIWGLLRKPDGTWTNDLLYKTAFNISTFGRDAQGEVYLADYGRGVVYRLDPVR